MALAKSSISSCEYCFSITKTDYSDQFSPQLMIGEVPWRFSFSRKMVNDKNGTLDVYLSCDYENESDWLIEAEGHLRIMSSKEGKKPIEMKMLSQKYMNSSRKSQRAVSNYEDFVCPENGYVDNGTFSVECTIAITSRPLIREPHLVECTSQHFIIRAENVDKWGSTTSPMYNLRGTNWYVKFQKLKVNLAVYLYKDAANQDFTLSAEATFNVKLLSFSNDVVPFSYSFKYDFLPTSTGYGWDNFIDWNKFIDKDEKYVRDNCAYFEVAIKIGPWKPIWDGDHSLKEINSSVCPICLEQLKGKNVVATSCGHLFCRECIEASIGTNPSCPVCKNIISEDGLRTVFM